jgi:hypothetical protein
MDIPPKIEWLSAKDVAAMFDISTAKVYRFHRVGRRNKSGSTVKLEMVMTLSGLVTTQKLIDDFQQRLNG